ncbi:hypothetical protein L228DRAFT_240528 [Xylona heveae TC161]|uniref:Uncharacterized protein n=1 Tax=Xylona heveae (strain CBS 132557 / TC161) TaxID=1328760 RepID=A0A165FAX0_XYLHT|nr:hypothetical protein L228DRAFT_240528 [Xylona heveae TC161]KZF20774.1 hypothetical protein L228DRAFT_240528 [Xylona heveae TC161]
MGLIKSLAKLTVYGGAATTGGFFIWTRNSQFVPFSTSDAIFQSAAYNKYNPEKNPTMHDLCVRRVPLSKIKPELQQPNGKLVEQFCAGVWSGKGYTIQREILARKYRGPETAHQLWTPSDLKASTYPVGTQITDHFEVLEHTPESIVVRCGDSPRKTEVRPGDGLFEIGAKVLEKEGVAEFTLKSVFYQGLGKASGPPMPDYIVWLHKQYTKLWMETAIWNVTA